MFGFRSAPPAHVTMWIVVEYKRRESIAMVSLAAVVNQIAIALCRRAQTATEPDLHEQWSPELQSRRRSRVRRVAGVHFAGELLDCLA